MDSSTTWEKRKHDTGRIYTGLCSIDPEELYRAVERLAGVFWPGIGEEWTYSNYRAVWTEEGSCLTVYADRRKTDGSGASLTPVDVAVVTVSKRIDGCYLEVFYSYDPQFALALVAMLREKYGATDTDATIARVNWADLADVIGYRPGRVSAETGEVTLASGVDADWMPTKTTWLRLPNVGLDDFDSRLPRVVNELSFVGDDGERWNLYLQSARQRGEDSVQYLFTCATGDALLVEAVRWQAGKLKVRIDGVGKDGAKLADSLLERFRYEYEGLDVDGEPTTDRGAPVAEAQTRAPIPNVDGKTWDDVFDWYHQNRDICRTLRELAERIAVTHGTVRNEHSKYMAQHGNIKKMSFKR